MTKRFCKPTSPSHSAIEASGVFALNFLGLSQRELAIRFAGADEDKFQGIDVTEGATRAPLLQGSLAYCECSLVDAVTAGDHTLFIGRVVAAGVGARDEPPLVYYRGRYDTVSGTSEPEAAP